MSSAPLTPEVRIRCAQAVIVARYMREKVAGFNRQKAGGGHAAMRQRSQLLDLLGRAETLERLAYSVAGGR